MYEIEFVNEKKRYNIIGLTLITAEGERHDLWLSPYYRGGVRMPDVASGVALEVITIDNQGKPSTIKVEATKVR